MGAVEVAEGAAEELKGDEVRRVKEWRHRGGGAQEEEEEEEEEVHFLPVLVGLGGRRRGVDLRE